MAVKELTDLTVTDLMREYKRSFVDYWDKHDEAIKRFRKQGRHLKRCLNMEAKK